METGQIPPFYRSEPLPGPFREIHRKGHRQSPGAGSVPHGNPGTIHPGHHQPELRTPVRSNGLRNGAIRRPGSHPAEKRWRWKSADRLPDAIPLPGSRGTKSPAGTFRCPPTLLSGNRIQEPGFSPCSTSQGPGPLAPFRQVRIRQKERRHRSPVKRGSGNGMRGKGFEPLNSFKRRS